MKWKSKYKRQQRYYLKHRKKILKKRQLLGPKEGSVEYQHQYYLKNREKIRKYKREKYLKSHPRIKTREEKELIGRLRKQIRNRKYLLKKNGNKGFHTLEEWEAKKKEYNYHCANCGEKEPFKNQYFKKLTEDHIVPVSGGGTNYIDNIQPFCHRCNALKREFIEKSKR